MVKRKRLEKKKRVTVRERHWESCHEEAFSHDRAKHRHALAKLPEHLRTRSPLPDDCSPNATAIAHARKWAFVRMDNTYDTAGAIPLNQGLLCLIDERLRETDATLLAPGDRIFIDWEGGNPVVRGIAPRSTTLVRTAGVHSRLTRQVIAANIEVLVVVVSTRHPPFSPGLVDRFLIAAQVGGVEPVLCVNKMDMVEAEPPDVALYRGLGLEVYQTSCKTGLGLEALRARLAGKLAVVAGHSGVGKSSLLNGLDPHLRILTREVSEVTRLGRHTTTGSRLYELENGIRVIDTPGIRTLGLWEVSPAEVSLYFPEIAAAATGCRYRNCSHIHEPGCSVKYGVDTGAVPQERYASYRRIREYLNPVRPAEGPARKR